jgi:hypothetical protein
MEYVKPRRRTTNFKHRKSFLMPNVVDLVDRIEEMFTDMPDKRKKKEYQEWKVIINKLIEEVNKVSKIKMYSIIK